MSCVVVIRVLHSFVQGVVVLSTRDFFIFKVVNDLSKVDGLSLSSLVSVGSDKFIIRLLAVLMLRCVNIFVRIIII